MYGFYDGRYSRIGNIITGAEIESAACRTKTAYNCPSKKPEPWSHGGPVPRACVSSNQFANGSDQNVGNVITDRRMIKINAPPGGHSSFSISTMFGEGRANRFE